MYLRASPAATTPANLIRLPRFSIPHARLVLVVPAVSSASFGSIMPRPSKRAITSRGHLENDLRRTGTRPEIRDHGQETSYHRGLYLMEPVCPSIDLEHWLRYLQNRGGGILLRRFLLTLAQWHTQISLAQRTLYADKVPSGARIDGVAGRR